MTLLRALYSEQLKLKRTVALQIVLLAPGLIVLLLFIYLYLQPPHIALKEWLSLESPALGLWAVFVMPLYITLETALVAGLDHSGNQWKSLLARPVPRWTLYVAKLTVVIVMTVISTAVLLCGILIDGAILTRLRPDVHVGFPVPWSAVLRDCAQVAGLSFPALTIQHWVSVRWRSFSVAFAFGVKATVFCGCAFAIGRQIGGRLQYLPWALPILPLTEGSDDLGSVLLIAAAAGLVVTAAGCWDFGRREVS